jgi:hypothetical protein
MSAIRTQALQSKSVFKFGQGATDNSCGHAESVRNVGHGKRRRQIRAGHCLVAVRVPASVFAQR